MPYLLKGMESFTEHTELYEEYNIHHNFSQENLSFSDDEIQKAFGSVYS